jgi:sulfur carrier protein ThiS
MVCHTDYSKKIKHSPLYKPFLIENFDILASGKRNSSVTLGVGFEPTWSIAPSALEADALVHSATPAKNLIYPCFINISMKVMVELFTKKTEVTLPMGSTVEGLLHQLSMFPDAVIVLSEGVVLPSSAPLTNCQRLKIIQVSSGG